MSGLDGYWTAELELQAITAELLSAQVMKHPIKVPRPGERTNPWDKPTRASTSEEMVAFLRMTTSQV